MTGRMHNNQPMLSVRVGWKDGYKDHLALIDTGFTGDVKLSPVHAATIGVILLGRRIVELADDRKELVTYGTAHAVKEGAAEIVRVLILPGEPIIGVGLLRKFSQRLAIDFHLGDVSLRRSPAAEAAA